MNRESFIFYRSYYEAIKDLPRDLQGEIYTAIMEYSLNGIEIENLKPIARTVFTLVKPQIQANVVRYENGSKGGRPKKNVENKNLTITEPKPNNNLTITEPKPNDNVNVNVNVNDNYNGKIGDVIQNTFLVPELLKIWIKEMPDYYQDKLKDGIALREIAEKIAEKLGVDTNTIFATPKLIFEPFLSFVGMVKANSFYKSKPLSTISNNFTAIYMQHRELLKGGKNHIADTKKDQFPCIPLKRN